MANSTPLAGFRKKKQTKNVSLHISCELILMKPVPWMILEELEESAGSKSWLFGDSKKNQRKNRVKVPFVWTGIIQCHPFLSGIKFDANV